MSRQPLAVSSRLERVNNALMAQGTITKDDLLGQETYKSADGSINLSPVFLLHSIKIGNVEVHNVRASTSKGDMPLLGQAFLRRFSNWSIDNTANVILLGPPVS
jgi:predicted aspartyl protease